MKNISPNEALNLLDVCPVAMLLIDADHSIRGCNAAFTTLTGLPAGSLESDLQQGLLTALLGDAPLVNWIMPDGEKRWLSINSVALGDNGVTVRCFLDVTETERLKRERDALNAELSETSLNDERMISLLSRHGILVSLAPLVARSRRYNSALSIVTINIDTDAERDNVLHRLSLLLKDQTRWADLVGCDKDGNFILVLQEAGHDAALHLVKKLVAKLTSMNNIADEQIYASYGIAQCNKTDDALSLLERAEAALVAAKSSEDHTSVAL